MIGAGLIGLEVAASACMRGCSVVAIEMASSPMQRVLAPAVAEVFTKLHADHGTELLFSTQVSAIGDSGSALSIETQVREDAITLFGFADNAEHDWFRLLRTVQGVGGKVALAILSTLTPGELANAVAAQDKASVSRANGVGPKLAQRIVSELKDKAAGMAMGAAAANIAAFPAPKGEGGDLVNDAVSALINLGYRRAEAFGAVSKVIAAGGKPQLNDLIVNGLRELSQ
ncbi:MAG: Holliday junction branch migration protein RuvA [Dongia sp.]